MYPSFWRRYIRVGILTRMYPCIFVRFYSILRAVFPVGAYVPTLVLVGTYVLDFVFCPCGAASRRSLAALRVLTPGDLPLFVVTRRVILVFLGPAHGVPL